MDARTHERYVEKAMENIGKTGKLWWTVVAILTALVALGFAAYGYQVANGHAVTGVSHTIFWGFYIANFVFFIGISYGGAITSAILRLTNAKWRAPITRLAEGTALVTLLVGSASVIVDVARPDRILNLVLYAQPGSPITWDWIAINTYLVGTIIFFYLPLIPDIATCRDTYTSVKGFRGWAYRALALRWHGTPAQEKALLGGVGIMAVLIIPLAVTVHSVLAWLFAVTVQGGWHSTIFAPLFVLGAMVSGVALIIIVTAGARRVYGLEEFITPRHFRYLSYLLLALGATYLYLMVSEYLVEGYGQTQDSAAVLQAMFVGNYAPGFWASVFGGIILPLFLVARSGKHLVLRTTIASLLLTAGMWFKRYLIILMPGMSGPLMPWERYQPTPVELLITIGALAAIPLGLMIMFFFFPVMSVHEMEEVEGLAEQQAAPSAASPAFAGGAK